MPIDQEIIKVNLKSLTCVLLILALSAQRRGSSDRSERSVLDWHVFGFYSVLSWS